MPTKKAEASAKLEGKTWVLSDYSKAGLVYEGDQVTKSHQFKIFGCDDTVIEVRGKCKSIMLEGCKKVTLIATGLISQVEMFNCKNCKVDVKESLPMVTLENTQELKIVLSRATMGAKVQTC